MIWNDISTKTGKNEAYTLWPIVESKDVVWEVVSSCFAVLSFLII